MEGPTPVSATLHSSTLVMAGFIAMTSLAVQASTSAFDLAAVAVVLVFDSVEVELKRLVAFSTSLFCTVTWLAFGLAAVGDSWVDLAVVHAFYKSATFVVFGTLIGTGTQFGTLGSATVLVVLVHVIACGDSACYLLAKHSVADSSPVTLESSTATLGLQLILVNTWLKALLVVLLVHRLLAGVGVDYVTRLRSHSSLMISGIVMAGTFNFVTVASSICMHSVYFVLLLGMLARLGMHNRSAFVVPSSTRRTTLQESPWLLVSAFVISVNIEVALLLLL